MCYSLGVNRQNLEVHGVSGCEYIGGSLHHTLPGLWHCYRSTPGYEHRVVSTGQGHGATVVTLHQDHLLVTEPHLTPRVAGHVHPTHEQSLVRFVGRDLVGVQVLGSTNQLRLNGSVVLLVDYVVHAVAVDQQVLLKIANVIVNHRKKNG